MSVLKTGLFILTTDKRVASINEIYKLVVQLLQGLVNFTLFILSYTNPYFDGVQTWFWDDPYECKNFWTNLLAAGLGCIEYYYVFLVACAAILIVILFSIWLAKGCTNPFESPHA